MINHFGIRKQNSYKHSMIFENGTHAQPWHNGVPWLVFSLVWVIFPGWKQFFNIPRTLIKRLKRFYKWIHPPRANQLWRRWNKLPLIEIWKLFVDELHITNPFLIKNLESAKVNSLLCQIHFSSYNAIFKCVFVKDMIHFYMM